MTSARDDAGGGRRGLRPQTSLELLDALERHYGVVPVDSPRDLGGASNLNLLVDDGHGRLVLRVYRPGVSAARLADIQNARRQLHAARFPCLAPIASEDGQYFAAVGASLIELEEYVVTDGRMNTVARVEEGLRALGAMHNVLRDVAVSSESESPPFVNYLSPEELVESCRRGVDRIRSWRPTPGEAALADRAEELVDAIGQAYPSASAAIATQLVHGDFWDNNVLYRGSEVVLIHDFDHMGVRARIEDVALTLYFLGCEPAVTGTVSVQWLRRMTDAYDAGLHEHLSADERAALPIALAKQPLWSLGRWIAELDDVRAAREHAAGLLESVELALDMMRTLPEWQDALV
jgi:homoserine kinase type II